MIIYHRGCSDGLCAAAVASIFTGDKNFIACNAGQTHELELPLNTTDTVESIWLVDLSARLDTIQKWEALGYRVVMMDHHELSEGVVVREGDVHDKTRSGARIVYDYFKHLPVEEQPSERVIDYVQDRDLWQWKLPNSKAVNAYLGTVDPTPEAWIDLLCTTVLIGELAHTGNALLKLIDQHVQKCASKVIKVGKVGIVYCTSFVSEVGDRLLKDNEDIDIAAMIMQESVSLRSRPGTDVSSICRQFGGGGHKQAAGFKTEFQAHLAHNRAFGINECYKLLLEHPVSNETISRNSD